MNPSRTKIILGPPGTGKTHRLLNIMEHHLKQRVDPTKICFVTFTRKGANEAKTRAIKKFKLNEEQLTLFKTLHSLAFHRRGLKRDDVMGFLDYINICKLLGLTISSQQLNDDGGLSIVHTKGDRLFFLENLSRATGQSLRDVWALNPSDDILFGELKLLAETLADYKTKKSKYDFTDMIQSFVTHNESPDVEVLIVDEAQDLSPLQWKMVDVLANRARYIYVAGDDDQAIFKWAGADVEYFQNLQGDIEVLNQSYRVPNQVRTLANRILFRIKKRNTKDYRPTKEEGLVKHHSSLETIDMKEGTWLLLARNIFFLTDYAKHCLQRGFIFESKYGSPITPNASLAIKTWNAIKNWEKVPALHAKITYDFMAVRTRVRYGYKKHLDALEDSSPVDVQMLTSQFGLINPSIPWYEALNKLKPMEVQYFAAALKSGEKLLDEPRIKINTIHGVKGGEADNVVLVTDVSKKTFEEYEKHPDDELRVWYVGVTRAKSSVHIISPQTPFFVEI